MEHMEYNGTNTLEQIGKFNRVMLLAPDNYWRHTVTYLLKVTNGMGPDTWWVNMIPQCLRNNILLLDVREAAIIHDYMYGLINKSYTYKEHLLYKEYADRLFLCNLMRIIEDNYNKERKDIGFLGFIERWFVKRRYKARKKEATKVYTLVADHGTSAFFANKYIDSDGRVKPRTKRIEVPNDED